MVGQRLWRGVECVATTVSLASQFVSAVEDKVLVSEVGLFVVAAGNFTEGNADLHSGYIHHLDISSKIQRRYKLFANRG